MKKFLAILVLALIWSNNILADVPLKILLQCEPPSTKSDDKLKLNWLIDLSKKKSATLTDIQSKKKFNIYTSQYSTNDNIILEWYQFERFVSKGDLFQYGSRYIITIDVKSDKTKVVRHTTEVSTKDFNNLVEKSKTISNKELDNLKLDLIYKAQKENKIFGSVYENCRIDEKK